MPTAIRAYVRSLDLDAYVVGGAVRDQLLGVAHTDEDFLVPGVGQTQLRELLAPHGRVEDMEVHGQLVGVRLHPHDRRVRELAPAGIELTPPRAERSTGPGHRDFAIVSGESIDIDEDMARRDFTVNGMAIRLSDGNLVDPFGGLGDLARRRLRTIGPRSFAEDPLRLVRALRFVSQLGLEPTGETLIEMHLEAAGLEHVSAERIGGGLSADGMGELSKLLLGRAPARALRLARDTGVLVQMIPEFAAVIGYGVPTARQPMSLEEHIFETVQAATDAGAPLTVRLAALVHDLGKPLVDDSETHDELGSRLARVATARLRYPLRVQHRVERIVRAHSFDPCELADGRAARRFLAEHGDELAFDLVMHKEADLTTKVGTERELAATADLRSLLEHERESPHRLSDLAVDGDDLKTLGLPEGPALGRMLRLLLEDVVEEPDRNERAWLLDRAAKELA